MTDREKMIAEAALQVFARYGTRRATMSDVADAAGVVRQTLYNIFPNKGALIHAAVVHYSDEARRAGVEAWQAAGTLPAQLDSLFLHNAIKPWQDWQRLPDILDLEQSDHVQVQAAISQSMAATRDSLTDLLTPYADVLSTRGQTPAGMATFIESALHGIKKSTSEESVLMAQLATFKATLLTFFETSTD